MVSLPSGPTAQDKYIRAKRRHADCVTDWIELDTNIYLHVYIVLL